MTPEDFVTSDTHFGHTNIIKYCNRPFASVEEMDHELVTRWNNKVPKGSTVYHLGDFCFYKDPAQAEAVIRSLNGNIHLAAGNHDNWWDKQGQPRAKWQRVIDCFETISHGVVETKLGKNMVVLCHYPIESWNGKFHGSWHFHGHSHGGATAMPGRLDAGVDGLPGYNNYAPWSCTEIVEHFDLEAHSVVLADAESI
jgi:calcineurin-like phosphoesterase family protein